MSRNVLINGVIVVIALASGAALSLKPWQVYQEQRRAADEQIAEMHAADAKRQELVRQEAALKTSLGKEELARKNGLLPPGEIPAPK